MMMTDEARSDFVLAAAGAALLPAVRGLITSIPLYPSTGSLVGNVLDLAWIASYLMLVPVIIGRHREQGLAAYQLAGPRDGLRRGVIVALPIVALGSFRGYSVLDSTTAVLGQFAVPLAGSPALGGGFDLSEVVLRFARIGVAAVGMVIFSGFLINRARDAFRVFELPLVEALRTFGMGAVAASIVAGLLMMARGVGAGLVFGATLTLALVILLADRLVYAEMTVSRAAILGPAIATVAMHVLASGGLFGGDLLTGLWFGTLGFGLMVAAAALSHTRASQMAWVPPILAAAVWPSCLSTASSLQLGGQFCF